MRMSHFPEQALRLLKTHESIFTRSDPCFGFSQHITMPSRCLAGVMGNQHCAKVFQNPHLLIDTHLANLLKYFRHLSPPFVDYYITIPEKAIAAPVDATSRRVIPGRSPNDPYCAVAVVGPFETVALYDLPFAVKE